MTKRYLCPVCGYEGLQDPPRSLTGGGSYEICPSCGFQFGVSDDDQAIDYARWRAEWVRRGMPWCSVGQPPPPSWNPVEQLKRLGD
jgi:hypothetical protein